MYPSSLRLTFEFTYGSISPTFSDSYTYQQLNVYYISVHRHIQTHTLKICMAIFVFTKYSVLLFFFTIPFKKMPVIRTKLGLRDCDQQFETYYIVMFLIFKLLMLYL